MKKYTFKSINILVMCILTLSLILSCSGTHHIVQSKEQQQNKIILQELIEFSNIIMLSDFGTPRLNAAVWLWYAKACEKFGKDVIIVVGHGLPAGKRWLIPQNTIPNHFWMRADMVIKMLRKKHGPERPIVLISCNEAKLSLTDYIGRDKNTWYAKNLVWIIPDYYWTDAEIPEWLASREIRPNYGYVGTLEEFVNAYDDCQDVNTMKKKELNVWSEINLLE